MENKSITDVVRLDPKHDDVATLRGFDTVLRTVGAYERGELAPPAPLPAGELRQRYVASDRLRWVGRFGGRVAGIVELTSGDASQPTAFARVYVSPEERGNGVGRALVCEVARTVSAAGAETASAIVLAGTPGAAFASALGAEVGDELVINALDLAAVDEAKLGATVEAGVSGYQLVHWRGAAPDTLVDSYAVAKRSIADAPNVHLPRVPHWDRELVRATEQDRSERGVELWVTAAVLTGTTTVAAFTAVEVGSTPVDVLQEDTVVLPGPPPSRAGQSGEGRHRPPVARGPAGPAASVEYDRRRQHRHACGERRRRFPGAGPPPAGPRTPAGSHRPARSLTTVPGHGF